MRSSAKRQGSPSDRECTGDALRDKVFGADLVSIAPSLRAYAQRLCANGPMAEDLVQETLCRAWAARASFSIGTNFRAWVFTILRNQFFSQHRNSWREQTIEDRPAAEVVSPENQEWSAALSDTVRALSAIAAEQVDMLLLAATAGLTISHLADAYGCPEGTVKSRIHRARTALKAALASSRSIGVARPAPGASIAALMRRASPSCMVIRRTTRN